MVKRCVSAPGVATKQIQPASEPFLRCRGRAHISNLAIGGVNGRVVVPRRTTEACCARGGAACTVRESSSIPPRREDKPALTGDSQTLRSNHVSKHWGSDSVTTLAHLPLKVALKSSG